MPPLLNPRYEAFAFALAAGSTVGEAYDEAGFHPNNRRSRADMLSQSPKVQARVAHLRATLDPAALRRRHAPAFTTIPQTKEDMKAWLWQIMAGVRKISIRQWQAAKLFARMNGWDALLRKELSKAKPGAPQPATPAEPDAKTDLDFEPDLPETTRVSLYLLSLIQADKEALRSANPIEPELHDFEYYPDSVYSDPPLLGEPWPEPPPPPDRSAATQEPEFPTPPHDPSVPLPPLRKWVTPSPWGFFGDTLGDIKSPSQSPDPQASTTEIQKPGDQKISSESTLAFQSRDDPSDPSDPSHLDGPPPQALNLEPLNLDSSPPPPASETAHSQPSTAHVRTLALQSRAEPTPDFHPSAPPHPDPIDPHAPKPDLPQTTANFPEPPARARRTVHPRLQPGETLAPGIKGNLNKGRLEPNLGDDGVWFGPSIYPKDPPKPQPPEPPPLPHFKLPVRTPHPVTFAKGGFVGC
ncbi:MAG: hypothetical protein U0984_12220 [Prosthecobacter sp.]|nr:hypothetical protein [Prosthecobacter sp.]